MSPASKLFFNIAFFRSWNRLLILASSFVAAIFGLLAPYFQKEFIDGLLGSSGDRLPHLVSNADPLLVIFLAFVCLLLAQGFNQLTNYMGYREAIIMQRKLATQLYDKMLNIRIDTMSRRPLGEIVSLYATDVPGATTFLEQTLPSGASTLFPLLLAPFALAWAFEIPLWPIMGTIMLVTIINSFLAFRQAHFFFNFKRLAAERIGLVNEWIQNIRTLRILSWIPYIEKKIFSVRVVETDNRALMVTNGQTMNAISTSITFALNVITLSSVLFFSDLNFSPGELMALLWIVVVFLTRPFRQMPWFFTFAFDSLTSIRRLSDFLNMQNEPTLVPMENSRPISLTPSLTDTAIDVRDLNLEIHNKKILDQIDFQVRPGEFIAIVGEVGSGKSMLLLSLMRETRAHFGHYSIFGQDAKDMPSQDLRKFYSYVPQEGFIMSGSLRENVAFLYDIPEDQDQEILESLDLAQFDVDMHSLGAEIGERGANLSGGQKQRVSLARVHFLRSNVLLLDDCLSALDVNTEERILRSLLQGAWKDKTRILVTHRLSVLPLADRIFFMENGRLIKSGTYLELLRDSPEFRNFTKTIQTKEDHGLPT